MSHHTLSRRRSVPDGIRRYSVLIALFWLGLAVLTNVFVPQLETVAEAHNVSLSPQDSPSLQASKRIGKVFGPPGTVATITYLDVNAQPQRVDNTTLPWAYDTTTTQPAVFVNVSAQGDSDSIGCRIKIDDAVKDERSVNTLNAYTYCLDKSG